ncbi:MAG: ECF-type sigma factor [Tahibacter sp.]
MLTPQTPVTEWLQAWRAGDAGVLPQLTEAVYAELRRMAWRRLRAEQGSATLNPTALVNEAFVRLCENNTDWNNRAHFFALAALHMRNVLVDHARQRHADKRGGNALHVTLGSADETPVEASVDLVELDQALKHLENEDPRTGKVIELTYFGGMNRDEVAVVLEISVPTVDRCLRYGRARLKQALTV